MERHATPWAARETARALVLTRRLLAAALLGVFATLPTHATGAATAPDNFAARPVDGWRDVAGRWRIEGADGQRLGEIDVSVENAIGARGRLAVPVDGASDRLREVFFDTRAIAPDRVTLNLFHGIGDRNPGTLTLTRDRTDPLRILNGAIDEGSGWRRVRLVRSGEPPVPAESAEGPDEEEIFDLPGVGVSGPPYRLRDLPSSGAIRVRATSDAASPVVGMLEAGYEDILVTACTPFVEASVFEERDFAGKLAILDGSWCEIEHADASARRTVGWVEGRHLLPMRERMDEGWGGKRGEPVATSAAYDHNGSTMRLERDGHAVRILYERPRDGLAAIGVGPGTLLFDGVLGEAGVLEGRARLFSGRCDTLDYSVSGVFAPGRTIVLTGLAPVRERGGCRVVGTRSDGGNANLLFTIMP